MATDLSFTLLNIAVNDTYVRSEVPESDVDDTNAFSWHFGYTFAFGDYDEDFETVTLNLWFELCRNEDDEVMSTLDITDTFKVTAQPPDFAKKEVLKIFLELGISNAQGVFSVIAERSPLAKLMVPDINEHHYMPNLIHIAQHDW